MQGCWCHNKASCWHHFVASDWLYCHVAHMCLVVLYCVGNHGITVSSSLSRNDLLLPVVISKGLVDLENLSKLFEACWTKPGQVALVAQACWLNLWVGKGHVDLLKVVEIEETLVACWKQNGYKKIIVVVNWCWLLFTFQIKRCSTKCWTHATEIMLTSKVKILMLSQTSMLKQEPWKNSMLIRHVESAQSLRQKSCWWDAPCWSVPCLYTHPCVCRVCAGYSYCLWNCLSLLSEARVWIMLDMHAVQHRNVLCKDTGFFQKNNHPRIHGFMELLAPPCPPNSMLGTPGVHGGLQKRNNQCSNSGLPLSCTSTLNWGVQGVLQSYLLMSMCFFEEPGIVPATVKASLRSSSSKGSNSNVASMPRTILFSWPVHGVAHATRHATRRKCWRN